MQRTSITKENIKLYALTSMQTRNKTENMKTTHPPCLDKALLFNVRKLKQRNEEQEITISPG